MRIETSVAEQDLTRFRQQLEGSRHPSAGDLVQATPAPTGFPPTGLGTHSSGAQRDRDVFLDGLLWIWTYRSDFFGA
jgi:hypothetical protein